jgi:hypothetical protein
MLGFSQSEPDSVELILEEPAPAPQMWQRSASEAQCTSPLKFGLTASSVKKGVPFRNSGIQEL